MLGRGVSDRVLLRRITFVLLSAASLAVLLPGLYLSFSAHPWDYLPFIGQSTHLDARSQLLNDKIDLYDVQMERQAKLVALLLVVSGVYAIAFVLLGHFAAERHERDCRRAVDTIHGDFAKLAGNLREIREQAERALERAAVNSGRVEELLGRHSRAEPAAVAPPMESAATVDQPMTHAERLRDAGPEASFEISDAEQALTALAVLAGSDHASLLAPVYRDLALGQGQGEPQRARFYRGRANALVPGIAAEPEFPEAFPEEKPAACEPGNSPDPVKSGRAKYNLAVINRATGRLDEAEDLLRNALLLAHADTALLAEIRYELACTSALRGPGHFEQAMEHLRSAFRGKTLFIEKRISRDIDDGGPLQALASRPPFDKAVNDLLLDVSVRG
jgi:tetratricopeptide (TPR) repeat protein